MQTAQMSLQQISIRGEDQGEGQASLCVPQVFAELRPLQTRQSNGITDRPEG